MLDMHEELALKIYGEVTRETRAKAKIINYCNAYGADDIKLARFAGCYPPPRLAGDYFNGA